MYTYFVSYAVGQPGSQSFDSKVVKLSGPINTAADLHKLYEELWKVPSLKHEQIRVIFFQSMLGEQP